MARTKLAEDNFNRADGVVGANYTQLNTTWGNVAITSNEIKQGANDNANTPYAQWSGSTLGSVAWANDQYSKGKITYHAFDLAKNGNACVRMSATNPTTSSHSLYEGHVTNSSPALATSSTKINKVVSGALTNLSSVGSDGFVIGDYCDIEAEGTTIRVMKNGVELRNVTDSSIDGTSSSAGVGAGACDDWEGGNLGTIAAAGLPLLGPLIFVMP